MTDALSPPPAWLPRILPDEGVITRENSSSSSSKDGFSTSSIVTVILVLSSAFFVSITLYLLLRYLSRRCSERLHSDDVVPPPVDSDRRFSSRRVSPEDLSLIDSLPLFTFGSVRGRNSSSAGDCAVCLSKFEPHDQLRLLPICCHAFHARCIDTWLASNQTCPLCRSPIYATEADFMKAILASTNAGDSFRIELGSVSRRRSASDSGEARRSYSVGSFDYVVDHESEVTVASNHRRGGSESSAAEKDKDDAGAQSNQLAPEPPGPSTAAEVASGRSWLKDYVDRLSSTASLSISSRALSFRSSGRFFTGSSRRNETASVGDWDLEANRVGEEISEMFRWFSGI
ncbi:hypothetical protein PVL29_019715 [Vitis rotundifolia]|uniref:RING-type E3 ubiquitin transferase n=1 Tax=Vitis rotundifolia TaxID=103349 RepID=A0AA38Z1C7_VITRO|nr:hypothetical protein PVL29_019715 [Vitis rotundifolia]